MKTLIKILVVALVSLAATAYAGKDDEKITIGGSKQRKLFVVKTEKKLIGARVEVYSSNGELVTSQHLQRRKMIIDFGSVMTDTYTIRIVKGNTSKVFQYVKR